MKVLVACEFSGVVRDAFIRRGHDAISCDLLPTEAPGPHYQGDVRDILGNGFEIMVAHPDCTFLCSSGLHWNKRVEGRQAKTDAALDFVRELLAAPISRIALENPVGCISTKIRKYDQMIQPYQFGHDASKRTCLWLKDLRPLAHGVEVPPVFGCSCGTRFALELGKYGCPNCCGDGKVRTVWGNQTPTGQNKHGPSADRWQKRAKTYQGIADAMAEQWGIY